MSKIWLSRLAQIQTTIRGFKAGNVFYLRDCISCPQALWERWFREMVDRGAIPGVVYYGKDTYGVNLYQRV